ncbi:hypothetical protein Ciccas_002615 [Cichlidogyrus casuarinus]|uniref:G-protein coupled receptors family 1 profile domain-containing protein n=1 Tax=Cichlidogyrus casuarinus TaxID=1844966 RepID=A0ABD2QJ00_9PLAT
MSYQLPPEPKDDKPMINPNTNTFELMKLIGFQNGIMIIFVVNYMPTTYDEQMEIYGTFTSKLVPTCLPMLSFFELFVVWLVLALLMDRLLYMKLGFNSKTMMSRALPIKISAFLCIFLVIYTIPKYLKYQLRYYENLGLTRVILTEIGQNANYQNMISHWFKVPIEMFLPYLGVAVFNSMIIAMMVKVHISKWRAIFHFNFFANQTSRAKKDCCCYSNTTKSDESRDSHEPSPSNTNAGHHLLLLQPTDPQNPPRQAIILEYDTVPPFTAIHTTSDEVRENANVLISVTIGFTLLIMKIPKFIIHILEMEQYVVYDVRSFEVTNYFIDVLFAAIKPVVCFVIGAHFRKALKVACGCAKREESGPRDSAQIEPLIMRNGHKPSAPNVIELTEIV